MDNKVAGLSIVCIVLAMLLVFSLLGSSPIPTVDNSRIQELEKEKQGLQNNINNLQSENRRLQNDINTLQDNIQEWRDVAELAKSQTVVTRYTLNQQAGSSNSWTVDTPYAGYIFVRIDSSTTNLAYARVSYTSDGGRSPHTISYDQRSSGLSSGSWTCFPVLPGSTNVYIGNTNLVNGATHTVTIEYWY